MTMKHLTGLLSMLTLFALSFQGCRYKKDYQDKVDQNVYSQNPTVNAGFYGYITDQDGEAIPGAAVVISGVVTTTDANGVFFLNGITTPANYTSVVVSKPGFFTGYRSIVVRNGDKHEVRVSLIRIDNYQSFIASVGGTIQQGNQFRMTFPPKALVNAQTGIEYQGMVYAYSKTIDPATEMGRRLMPGDLRGVNLLKEVTLMHHLGLVHVDLYDVNGNQLELKEDQYAAFEWTLSGSQVAGAPATLAMWHFDTEKGIWNEASVAARSGNTYTGQVNDMSFWSFAASEPTIQLQMAFMDQNNFPLSGYTVKVKHAGHNDTRYALTSATGWTNIYVYPNSVMTLELYADHVCPGTPVYTKTIQTGGFAQNLGTTVVTISNPGYCRLSGTIVDCAGYPLGDGALFVHPLGLFVIPYANGQFSHSLPCTPTGTVFYNGYNTVTKVYDRTQGVLFPGENYLGNIYGCDKVDPFLNITLTHNITNQSVTTEFRIPADNLYTFLESPLTNSFASVVATNGAGKLVQLQSLDSTAGQQLVTDGQLSGIGGTFTDTAFTIIAGQITYNGYPAFPADIIGTFILTVKGLPSNATYTATGNFRVPRIN